MAKVLIDGQELELDDNERLNGIEAAEKLGVKIPHYCWHPGLSVVASCRMCLVETGRRDPESGEVSMLPKLVPACQTPASDGTVFLTDSEKVRNARAMVEEDLLIRHPIDCPICDKAGECHLQDYHFQHGREERRADLKPFTSRRRPMGDTVTLFVDRCVMCSRCVRFTREITGTAELMVVNRGAHEEIDVFPGFPLDNKMSGNVVDLCPVGALGDTDFLYSQRVWFMKQRDNVCAGCSQGCSIHVEENQDQIYRIKPRENPHVNKWWMCDDGRYGFKHVHAETRLTAPYRRVDGVEEECDWDQLVGELQQQFAKSSRIAVVLSPHLTVEEAYLLASFARQVDSNAWLVRGPIPVVGEDESYPGGFTIRAEKCPNRLGVESIVDSLGGKSMSFDELLNQIDEVDACWIAGGYVDEWADDATASRFANLKTLVVQDLFKTPMTLPATHVLPAAAFAERSGSYVNDQHRLQSFEWAIRPPAGTWIDGHVFWRLLGRPGMYHPTSVLKEIASKFSTFSAATCDVPPLGIDLRIGDLATT